MRHRFGVITAAVLVVLVLSSAIALAVQARRTAGERDRRIVRPRRRYRFLVVLAKPF